jgi:preprotein translocase subunit SecG
LVADRRALTRSSSRRSLRGFDTAMMVFAYTLVVLLIITSVLLTLLILLHRGKGGGLSSMFGGGVSTSLAGSSIAEKNLDRYTLVVGIIWFACIVGFGLWLKVSEQL